MCIEYFKSAIVNYVLLTSRILSKHDYLYSILFKCANMFQSMFCDVKGDADKP